MARRLATEYVKTCLELSEAELRKLIDLFLAHEAQLTVKVLDNGNQEMVLRDDADANVTLSFERSAGKYVCTGSCTLTNPQLVNAMRKAVAQFKGSAIVRRIYIGYEMVYHYERGSVVRIVEVKDGLEKLVYEYHDTIGRLERVFRKSDVECEIAAIGSQIDRLLDARNAAPDTAIRRWIDERLQALTHRLFALEA